MLYTMFVLNRTKLTIIIQMKKGLKNLAKYPLYILSLLPFRVLYVIADLLYFVLYYIVKYRRNVVHDNLKNSFPEKNEQELLDITKKFYVNLVDTMVESLKMASMTRACVLKRLVITNTSEIRQFYDQGRAVIIVTAHYGNWEWGTPIIASVYPEPVMVVYKPVANKNFEAILNGWRSRFGGIMVPMKQTLRAILSCKSKTFAIALVGDQTPVRHEAHYFTDFLNQRTAIFLGVEKIAVKTNMPVIYAHLNRLKRGYYDCTLTTLFENPKDTKLYEITEGHTQFLEQIIRKRPEMWLWSHRRWKFKEEDV
ncbi:Lipid A biosynthesis lauroyl acyltransferase [Arcticibacter svalbardensis MN12-7]|uniref:Lipid A biosynthesis lauroyl acyltransferase n=2 Tax=Arcticibacter TaxID=1288026 RepID=R9GVJ8_9SPHI|nr:Lipid A biosynthesis lauroyl acyltransferase [Arcticibacter svalbardensis MN12-7]